MEGRWGVVGGRGMWNRVGEEGGGWKRGYLVECR